jgi:uncharacterized heparinase superfamily protein
MSQASGGFARRAKGFFVKLQSLRGVSAPDAPALSIRDPWPGDPGRGARLVKGELEFFGATLPMPAGVFGAAKGASKSTPVLRAHAASFVWLRDLRALGTDAARSRARALASDFMDTSAPDELSARPDVTGARITAWLGHYDFFAASADDEFRQRLMGRLVLDARSLSVALPFELRDQRALTALKGLLAASVAMPDHAGYLARGLKFLGQELGRQILADGCHVERSPAAHLAALQDLTEIRALLQAGGAEPPEALPLAIERMASALRALRHGDGGLALFNGSKEDLPSLIELVLSQAGRGGRVTASLGASGFYRLAAGKALVIADAGPPAAAGLDRNAHAGALSFEFSSGKERLIVNCGAAPAAGPEWREALRATAAHSTLTIADVSSSELREGGLGRRPLAVNAVRRESAGAHWLEASHDGWGKLFGSVHHRRLYLSESGDDLRGDDVIEAATPQPFTIRFHLHPNVTASLQQDHGAVLLRLPSGHGYRLRADGAAISVEESVYFGGLEPRRAEQVVLAGHQDGPQQVKWAITRLG